MPYFFFFFQAEDGIRDHCVTGVQTCALPISKYTAPEGSPSLYRAVSAPSSSTSAAIARSWKNPSSSPCKSSNSLSPSSFVRCSTTRQRAPGNRAQEGGAFSPYIVSSSFPLTRSHTPFIRYARKFCSTTHH